MLANGNITQYLEFKIFTQYTENYRWRAKIIGFSILPESNRYYTEEDALAHAKEICDNYLLRER